MALYWHPADSDPLAEFAPEHSHMAEPTQAVGATRAARQIRTAASRDRIDPDLLMALGVIVGAFVYAIVLLTR